MALEHHLYKALMRFIDPILSDEEQLIELSSDLDRKVTHLEMNVRDAYVGPDLRVVREMGECAQILLLNYKSFSVEQRSLAVAAVRYFIASRDAIPDGKPITGLDDDAAVMNYVLDLCGKTDCLIS